MTPFDLIGTERYRASPFSVPCPHCGGPSASYQPHETKSFSTNESEIAVDYGGAEPAAYRGTIFGCCRCQNSECQERVFFLGTFTTELDDSGIQPAYSQKFIINFFFPAAPLIQIPPETPQPVMSLLKRSFAVAFMDQSASGSLLRRAVESLLTEVGVPRFRTGNGKRKRLWLHDRIEMLPPKVQSYKTRLLASKWVGNAATHNELGVEHLRVSIPYSL